MPAWPWHAKQFSSCLSDVACAGADVHISVQTPSSKPQKKRADRLRRAALLNGRGSKIGFP